KAIGYLSLATASYLMVAVLGPEFISGVLGLPQQDFAFIIAPAGLGVLVGVLAVGRIAGRLGPGPAAAGGGRAGRTPRGLLGVLAVGRIAGRLGPERTIDWGVTAAGILLVLLGLLASIDRIFRPGATSVALATIVVAGMLAALLGVANAFILAPSQSLLQSASPPHVRARVYGAFFTVSNAVAFIPIIFAGALADLFGVAKVLVAIGAILAAAGLVQLLRLPKSGRS